jgi:hypothetical protein
MKIPKKKGKLAGAAKWHQTKVSVDGLAYGAL